MEINTEINKVFGSEMAKVFASSITEEEIQAKANEVCRQLNNRTNEWGRRSNSEIETYIKNVLLDRLHDKILEILKEPENEESIEKRAREMVNEARRVADEAIVRSIANSICERTLSVWNSHDKFVVDVLQVLQVEKEKGRL